MRVQQSCVILSCAVMLAGCVGAQQDGPASSYPVDSAPPPQAKTFVFPEKGQSPEQQEQDDFTCYKWAKQQTGYDPEHPDLAAAPPPPRRRPATADHARRSPSSSCANLE